MNLQLQHALNRLTHETQAFLNEIDPDLDRWETYMARREAIFTELHNIECSVDELAEPTIVKLKVQITDQEALVRSRALATLAGLKEKVQTLKVGRRALQGYGIAFSSPLFERNF